MQILFHAHAHVERCAHLATSIFPTKDKSEQRKNFLLQQFLWNIFSIVLFPYSFVCIEKSHWQAKQSTLLMEILCGVRLNVSDCFEFLQIFYIFSRKYQVKWKQNMKIVLQSEYFQGNKQVPIFMRCTYFILYCTIRSKLKLSQTNF